MELKHLQVFLNVAEAGSFSKAAENLGYSQSTISFHIKQLEDELGCLLFDRIGKNIQLTDRGEVLMEQAVRVNNSVQDLMESFHRSDKIKGTVCMYSSDSICEKMMLLNYHNFYAKYPDIKLIFHTGSTVDMLKTLDKNESDIIFTLDSHICSPEYVVKKESKVSLHFVANSSHPLSGTKNLHLKDLMDYPFVLTEKGMSYRKILDSHLAEQSIQIEPCLTTGRTDIIVKSLLNGMAIGFLPDFVIEDELTSGSIVKLDVVDFTPTIWKQLIVHRDKWISRPLQAFIDFVSEHEFVW